MQRFKAGVEKQMSRKVKPIIIQHCNLMGSVFTDQWLSALSLRLHMAPKWAPLIATAHKDIVGVYYTVLLNIRT